MKLHELPAGKSRKSKKRIGRGHGSGWVKTSGKGQKGQKSRSHPGIAPGFEGGALSMFRRAPKFGGFTSINRVEYTAVNLDRLNCFEDGAEVTIEKLVEKGLIRNAEVKVKVLARGDLEKKLKIHAHAWSESAAEKVGKAGGELIKIG